MIIEVLICKMDGTQKLIREEVPDNFFTPEPEGENKEITE